MSDEEYEVEKVLDKRVKKVRPLVNFSPIFSHDVLDQGQVEYLVKWRNYDDPDDNTWEPADNLKEAKTAIDKFEKVNFENRKLHRNVLLWPFTFYTYRAESIFKFSYLHVLGYQVDGNSVLGSPRNDHICVFLCREAELLKGGLYQGCVLRGEDHQLRLGISDLWWKMFLYSFATAHGGEHVPDLFPCL